MASLAVTPRISVAHLPVRPSAPVAGHSTCGAQLKELCYKKGPKKPGGCTRLFTLLLPAHIDKAHMAIYFGKVTYIDSSGHKKEVESAFKICKFPFPKEKPAGVVVSKHQDYAHWKKHQAMKEGEILNYIKAANVRNVVTILASFWKSDIEFCIAMNRLPPTLAYSIHDLKISFKLSQTALCAIGIVECLEDLMKTSVIHCDIKPDNICLEGNKAIVFDFEGSFIKGRGHSFFRTTYRYRSPEYLSGEKLNFPLDMWSLCPTLFEMYTGKTLFASRTAKSIAKDQIPKKELSKEEKNRELMHAMVALLGMPPISFYHTKNGKNFFRMVGDKLELIPLTHSSHLILPTWKDIEASLLATAKAKGDSEEFVAHFLAFLKSNLTWDPKVRQTPSQALESDFLKKARPASKEEKKSFAPLAPKDKA